MPRAIYHQAPGHDIPVELTWRIIPENRAEKRRASEAFDLVDEWGDVLVSDVKEGEKPGQFGATEAAKAEAKAKGQASSNSGSSEVERLAAENAALKAESEAQRAAAVRARSEGLAEVQQLKADLEAAKAAAAKASPAAAAAQKPVK